MGVGNLTIILAVGLLIGLISTSDAYGIRHAFFLVNENDMKSDPNTEGYYFQRRTRGESESVGNFVRSIMLHPNMRRITRNVGYEPHKRGNFHRTGGAIIIG